MNNLKKFAIGAAVGVVAYMVAAVVFDKEGFWITYALIMILSLLSPWIFQEKKECKAEDKTTKS